MKPGDKLDPLTCRAVQSILSRVGDKWTVLVVAMLHGGPARFNELRRSIDGISQRMLTLTLRSLERDGLVSRTVYPTSPPRVDYALTGTGRTLTTPMIALAEWAVSQRDAIEEARERFDRRNAAKPAAEKRAP
jgi:DNA-binding HxlR family transcriptional regulator